MPRKTFGTIVLLGLVTSVHAQFTFTKIADTSTAIPAGSGAFTDLRYPAVRGSNAVFYADGASSQKGIYFWNGSTLSRVADLATPVPSGTGNFTNINFNAYAISTNTVVFVGNSTGGVGLYQGSNNVLTRLVDSSFTIPSGSGSFTTIGAPRFDDDGKLAFTGSGTSQQGIYLLTNATPVMVANKTTALPGGVNYNVSDIGTLRGGKIAFWNFNSASYNGIYHWDGTAFTRVASTNTTIPGFGITFDQFYSPPDLDGGKVIFKCSTFTGGYKAGIYEANPDGTGVATLVDTTMTRPSETNLFGDFLGFRRINGLLVFAGYGPPSSLRGIYTLSNSVLARVLGPDDALDGKVVQHADMITTGFADGMLGILVTFTNSTKGIYLTRVAGNSAGTPAPSFGGIQRLPGGQFQLTLNAAVGTTNRLQYSTNLTSWTDLITNLVFTGSSLTLTNAPPILPARFYRLVSP